MTRKTPTQAKTLPHEHEKLLKPLRHSGKAFYALVAFLSAIVAFGAYAWYVQITNGLVVTGLRNIVFWGVYLTNFVFFIGISHSGAFISSVLRLTNAEWRRPLTRLAEAITIFSLIFAVMSIIFDMGRPDRLLNVFIYGRLESPIVWDFISISTYLTGSLIFLYLPLIPDIALCRDTFAGRSDVWAVKKWVYKTLSLNWTGTERQKRFLERGIKIMSILILPIMVMVHTTVSWVFAVTLKVGWHSTIFGPYFVTGAIVSGVATVILAMALFRRVYHLEEYIEPLHFKYLGYLLLALDILYIYFMVNEYVVSGYGGTTADVELLQSLFMGQYATVFWLMFFFGLILPAAIIVIPKTRTIKGIVVAAVLANVGMWVKRFIIIVPALLRPLLPYEVEYYTPTWVELSITAASFAGFVLLYILFSRVFPIVSIWEVSENQKTESYQLESDDTTQVKE